jgi:riboflavin-specific deaminase-like protein
MNFHATTSARAADHRKGRRPARPFVLINMAISADGKIATANRRITTFGSRADLDHLYQLRAAVDAVMCGARTVIESNADLGAGPQRFKMLRKRRGLASEPLRVVISGSARLPVGARVFHRGTGPLIVIAARSAPRWRFDRLRRLAWSAVRFGDSSVDLKAALAWLHREWGVRRLLCEGGGQLNAALLRAGLVDELHLTVCPVLLGGGQAPTLADGARSLPLPRALKAVLRSRRRVGMELFLVYRLHPSSPIRPTPLRAAGSTIR